MASARVASRFRNHRHHIVSERNCAIGRDGHRTRNKTCENQNEKEQHPRTGEGLATQAYCVTVCHDRIVKTIRLARTPCYSGIPNPWASHTAPSVRQCYSVLYAVSAPLWQTQSRSVGQSNYRSQSRISRC